MPGDVGQMRDLVREAAHATEPDLGFDEDAFLEAFHAGLMGRDHTVFVAESHNGRLAGFLLCRLDGFYFAAGLSANLVAIYVTHEYRGSRAAACLLDAFFEWSARLAARKVYLSIDNNPAPKQAVRLLARYGARPIGVRMAK